MYKNIYDIVRILEDRLDKAEDEIERLKDHYSGIEERIDDFKKNKILQRGK